MPSDQLTIIPPTGGDASTNNPLSGSQDILQNKVAVGGDKAFGEFTNNTKKSFIEKLSINTLGCTIGMTIFVSVGIVFLALAKINIWGDTRDPAYANIVQTYKTYMNDIDVMFGYPGISKYRNLITVTNDENINSTINSTIPFIFKRDILEETVMQIVGSILTKSQALQDINKDINKYGFIHPDIMSLFEKNKEQIPIMVSLHTLETIKFGTALKIFSMLDTFLQQASQKLNIPKDKIATIMESYTERGEKDIANYLSMCYLNPYEQLPNCNQINDFNNYFIYENSTAEINTSIFSNIINLIETKLEKSEVESLQIDFNRFNPNVKNIGFRVTVNTLAEDDVAFLARGIVNPHIFIISTLVTLLKQSFFVIGDSINVDTLNIKKQTINIGSIQVPVNTSFMMFDLPLQNTSEREIFDFSNNN